MTSSVTISSCSVVAVGYALLAVQVRNNNDGDVVKSSYHSLISIICEQLHCSVFTGREHQHITSE